MENLRWPDARRSISWYQTVTLTLLRSSIPFGTPKLVKNLQLTNTCKQARHACCFAMRDALCVRKSDCFVTGECENGFLGGCAILASRMAPYKRDLQGNLSILYVKYADITNGLHDPFIHGRLPEGKMRILVQHSVRPSSMGTDEQTPSHALHQHQANNSIVDHKLERRWGGEGNDVWHHNQRHHNQKAFGAAPLPQNAYAAAPPGYLYESLLAGSLSPLAPAVASSIAARGAYQALSRAGSTATLPNASATHRQHQYARDGDRHDHSGYEAADDSIKSSRSGTGMHSARSGTGHRNSPRWLMYM